jgi:prefoldin subunit 5
MEKVMLIAPKDGENTHIQSHEQINRTLVILNNEIEELKKQMKSVVRKQNTIDKLS